MITQKLIDNDFEGMKNMLDSINSKMKNHINKEEVLRLLQLRVDRLKTFKEI